MKTKIAMMLVCFFLLISATSAFAYTECIRTVSKVWTRATGIHAVWVYFAGAPDHGPVYMASSTNSPQMDKFYSMALTAVSTKNKVIVRYPEDGANCASQPARNDFEGMWISNER